MPIIIFNAILFIVALFFYWLRWRKFDLGFILILTYTLVAIIGVFYYQENASDWIITTWPYIYLFSVLILFFRPYFINNQKFYDGFRLNNKIFLKLFSRLYILCGFIAIYYQIPIVIENLESGDWYLIRNTLYEDEIELYQNQFERLAKIFIQYFRLPAILALFYYLSAEKNKYFFNLIFAISIIVPSFFTAIIVAARGSLLVLIIELIIGFFIFRKNLQKGVKRVINTFALGIIVMMIIFSIAVTNSRFGELDVSSSLLHYFSHSFLTFNYGVVDSIENFANGKYFFNFFYDSQYIDFFHLGTHFDTSFITFVGTLYLDFGPTGTFLIALIVPFFFNFKKKSGKNIDFGDLHLYSFYLSYLLIGVFVIGTSNSLDWIIALSFYWLLKFIRI